MVGGGGGGGEKERGQRNSSSSNIPGLHCNCGRHLMTAHFSSSHKEWWGAGSLMGKL